MPSFGTRLWQWPVTAAQVANLLATGQITTYHIGNDADYHSGLSKQYDILSTGLYSGTSNLDVAHYAAATISFNAATSTISDSASGLATILTGDTIVVKGSALNDGIYTVKTGGVAGSVVVNEALPSDEAASRYVSIYKRTTHSNICVYDRRTARIWSQTTSSAEKVGPTSDGKMSYYDVAMCFVLHPAAADLAIVPPNILRIVGGAAEITRYHIGDLLVCTGFANAVNKLPGFRVTNVTVNSSDLDITLWIGNQTLIAEAAAGSRSISLECCSIFAYAAAANAVNMGGYSDWRVPNVYELLLLADYETPTAAPDPVAFPGWPAAAVYVWAATERADAPFNQAFFVMFANGGIGGALKTATTHLTALVR